MLKKLFTLLFLVIGFVQFSPAYACSGGQSSTLSELVANSDVIVQGRMDTVDERGQNGVMEVQKVFSKTDVPQFILLDLAPSGFIYREQERFSSGGCFHGVYPPLDTKQAIIIFLKEMPNGAYHLAPRHFTNPFYYTFPDKDSIVPVYPEIPNTATSNSSQPTPIPQVQEHDADSTTFPQLITAAVGQPPHTPQLNTPYPLPTTLYIRTVNGTEYELPVDLSTPNLITTKLADENGNINPTGCLVVFCKATSPNGVDSAQVTPDYTIQITSYSGASAPGTAFQFSSTSDTIAVWNTDTLSVYALPYERLGFCCYDLNLINSLPLTNVIKNVTHVAWSPDGRLVAYNDSTGLYLWDVFTAGSRPRLLAAPLYKTVTARFFSTTGRYLAIQRGDQRFYLDMVSGAEIPDGIISPDDRNQLQFDTQHPSPLQLYRLAPYLHKELLTDYTNVRQTQWIDRSFYLVAGCTDQQPNECHVWEGGLLIGRSAQFDGFAFAYDRVTNVLALAMSGKRIGILDRTWTLNTYDFSASLDSEIQTIEWMQPILFQPNL